MATLNTLPEQLDAHCVLTWSPGSPSKLLIQQG